MEGKKCIQCGNEFFKKEGKGATSNFKKSKYCSRACYHAGKSRNSLLKRECVICGNTFEYWAYRTNAKCCSLKCVRVFQDSESFKEQISLKHKGKEIPEEVRRKLSEAQKGKRKGIENHLWKGDQVGYRAIHEWIRRERGSPDQCEHCGIIGSEAGKRLVWANKSHEYKRELDDWIRLCYPCHRKHDFPNEKHRHY